MFTLYCRVNKSTWSVPFPVHYSFTASIATRKHLYSLYSVPFFSFAVTFIKRCCKCQYCGWHTAELLTKQGSKKETIHFVCSLKAINRTNSLRRSMTTVLPVLSHQELKRFWYHGCSSIIGALSYLYDKECIECVSERRLIKKDKNEPRISHTAGRWEVGWEALESKACTGSPRSVCPECKHLLSDPGSVQSQIHA